MHNCNTDLQTNPLFAQVEERRGKNCWSHTAWVHSPDPAFTGWVHKLLHIFVPQFLYKVRLIIHPYLTDLLWGLNCLAHSKGYRCLQLLLCILNVLKHWRWQGDLYSLKATEVRQSPKLLPAPILITFFPKGFAISYQVDAGMRRPFLQGSDQRGQDHATPILGLAIRTELLKQGM